MPLRPTRPTPRRMQSGRLRVRDKRCVEKCRRALNQRGIRAFTAKTRPAPSAKTIGCSYNVQAGANETPIARDQLVLRRAARGILEVKKRVGPSDTHPSSRPQLAASNRGHYGALASGIGQAPWLIAPSTVRREWSELADGCPRRVRGNAGSPRAPWRGETPRSVGIQPLVSIR